MKHWSEYLSREELRQVEASQNIATYYSDVPIPGLNLLKLVAHLVNVLEDYDKAFLSYVQIPVIQQVAWSPGPNGDKDGCWRDLVTGVRVELKDRTGRPFADLPGSS